MTWVTDLGGIVAMLRVLFQIRGAMLQLAQMTVTKARVSMAATWHMRQLSLTLTGYHRVTMQ